jgi:septal ring factor EnvC (AmiA/AmiB activator)
MNSKRAAAISLSVVFVLGLFVGLFVDRYFLSNRMAPGFDRRHRPDFVERLTKDLKLSADQQAQLKTLLAELKTKHDKIREAVGPQYRQVRDDFHSSFKKILTQEQQKKFDEFTSRENPRTPPPEPPK